MVAAPPVPSHREQRPGRPAHHGAARARRPLRRTGLRPPKVNTSAS